MKSTFATAALAFGLTTAVVVAPASAQGGMASGQMADHMAMGKSKSGHKSSKDDMAKMKACKKMSADAMAADAGCSAMMQSHPDMMKGHGAMTPKG